MRNSTEEFLTAVETYLKAAFSSRAGSIKVKDIVSWKKGHSTDLYSMDEYPAVLLSVDKKNLKDIYTTTFSLSVGIAIKAEDETFLDELGNIWSDILEDSIRSDWHLGEACLNTKSGSDIQIAVKSGILVISTTLICDVDIGGFVYENAGGEV